MERIRLGDICEIINGYAFKSEKYVNSGIRVIRIANVQKGYIEDNDPVFYPKNYLGIDKYKLKEGDLLISLTGNVGRVAILQKEMLPAVLNQRVACMRIKSSGLSKRYLFHFLNSDYFENKCIHASKGVAQKNMSTEWLKEYEIPLYSEEKQAKIETILDKLSLIISNRKEVLNQLDNLIRARFVEMFGDIIINDRLWKNDNWSNVVKIVNGKNQKSVESNDGKYVICGSGGIMGRATDYLTEENSVIIGRKGNINKPILMREKYWNVDTAFGVEPNENYICVEYLYMFCLFFDFNRLNKAVTIPSLTKMDLLNISMPIPDLHTQKRFATFVQQVDKSKLLVASQPQIHIYKTLTLL